MPIVFQDLGGDADTARRVIVRTRQVAPCALLLPDDGEPKAEALAILKAVMKRAIDAGTGVVASQGRNGTNISFREIRSAFTDDDVADLRSLCDGEVSSSRPLPLGSFPKDRPLANMWPEGEYS
jgi:hypothetical protein